MQKLIRFGDIGQFRNVIHDVKHRTEYAGKDADGNAIYDPNKPKPVITFYGTVKLHGTNGGVSYNRNDGLWVQSRENIIVPGKDNAGFAMFVEKNKPSFHAMFDQIYSTVPLEDDDTITIFGEWVGKGIQSGVGISQLEKSFFVFAAKITPAENEDNHTPDWIDCRWLSDTPNRIFNILHYETYSLTIDFNNPSLSQNALGEITTAVEANCPVAHAHGIDGVGEGVVWSTRFPDEFYCFKVKGEKHSVSKVKTLAAVDVDKLNIGTLHLDCPSDE